MLLLLPSALPLLLFALWTPLYALCPVLKPAAEEAPARCEVVAAAAAWMGLGSAGVVQLMATLSPRRKGCARTKKKPAETAGAQSRHTCGATAARECGPDRYEIFFVSRCYRQQV